MVSDDELERHVRQTEQGERANEPPVEGGPEAREIHNELARRIEAARADAADADDLREVLDRLERVESRLSELESRLD